MKLTWVNGSAPVTGLSAQILTDNNWFGQVCVFVYGKNWNLMFWIDFEKPFFFLFSFFDQIEILNIQRDSTNASDDLNVGKVMVTMIHYPGLYWILPESVWKKGNNWHIFSFKNQKTDHLTCETSDKLYMASISDILFSAYFGNTLENENIFGSSWG